MKKLYVSSQIDCDIIYRNIEDEKEVYKGSDDFPCTAENYRKINTGEHLADAPFLINRLNKLKGVFLTQLESMGLEEKQLKASKDIIHSLTKIECIKISEILNYK